MRVQQCTSDNGRHVQASPSHTVLLNDYAVFLMSYSICVNNLKANEKEQHEPDVLVFLNRNKFFFVPYRQYRWLVHIFRQLVETVSSYLQK